MMYKKMHLTLLLLLGMTFVGAGSMKAQDSEPVLTVTPANNTIGYEPGSGTMEVVANNFSMNDIDSNSGSFEWYDDEGEPANYDWITLKLSDDKSAITYTVTGNMSNHPRTAYFKLKLDFESTSGGGSVYSEMISVTQDYTHRPVLSITPANTILKSNAEGITGTLTATIYNFPRRDIDSEFCWYSGDPNGEGDWEDYAEEPDWIHVEYDYDNDKNTVYYEILEENTSSQPRTTFLNIILDGNLPYDDEEYEYDELDEEALWSNLISISQPGILKGDMNSDGKVTVSDLMVVVDIFLGKDNIEPYKYNHTRADMNGDNTITIADVIEMVNIILGKTE